MSPDGEKLFVLDQYARGEEPEFQLPRDVAAWAEEKICELIEAGNASASREWKLQAENADLRRRLEHARAACKMLTRHHGIEHLVPLDGLFPGVIEVAEGEGLLTLKPEH